MIHNIKCCNIMLKLYKVTPKITKREKINNLHHFMRTAWCETFLALKAQGETLYTSIGKWPKRTTLTHAFKTIWRDYYAFDTLLAGFFLNEFVVPMFIYFSGVYIYLVFNVGMLFTGMSEWNVKHNRSY